MACSIECLDFMEKCYRAEEYKPPVLSFDLFEKIGIDVEVARQKHKFNEVLTIIDSVNKDYIWKEVVCIALEYVGLYCEEFESHEFLEMKSMSHVDRVTYICERTNSYVMSHVFVTYLNDKWGQSIWFNKQYDDHAATWAWESHDPNSGRNVFVGVTQPRIHLPPKIYNYTPEFTDPDTGEEVFAS